MPLFFTLNSKKTKFTCFSIGKLPATESLNIRIKDEIVEVSEEKYFGIVYGLAILSQTNQYIIKALKILDRI